MCQMLPLEWKHRLHSKVTKTSARKQELGRGLSPPAEPLFFWGVLLIAYNFTCCLFHLQQQLVKLIATANWHATDLELHVLFDLFIFSPGHVKKQSSEFKMYSFPYSSVSFRKNKSFIFSFIQMIPIKSALKEWIRKFYNTSDKSWPASFRFHLFISLFYLIRHLWGSDS